MEYPTKNGIVLSPYEIEMPRAYRLETNNHHGEWEARHFGKNVLLLMVRNLACLQWDLPVDQHNWLHCTYSEPRIPTPYQAMDKIEEQLDCQGLLKIKHKGKGYIKRPLTEQDYKQCVEYYNSFRG